MLSYSNPNPSPNSSPDINSNRRDIEIVNKMCIDSERNIDRERERVRARARETNLQPVHTYEL
jgi:hypothetical protein